MDIYVALHDRPDPEAKGSFVVGAFSKEWLAQKACQDDYAADEETAGRQPATLTWKDAEAHTGDGKYAVVLVILDEPVA